MSAVSLAPIKTLLDLLVDGAKDGISVAESGKPILQEISVFTNLVADIPALVAALPSIPSSLSGFSESDGAALIEYVIGKGVTDNAKVLAIINASLTAANALWAVYQAVSSPAAAPAAS